MKTACIAAVFVALATACGGEAGRVSRSDFGDKWPLKVETGVLECHGGAAGGPVTFRTDDGTVYAVNGLARGPVAMRENGWRELDEISLPHPTYPDVYADVTPLIEKGLTLCN